MLPRRSEQNLTTTDKIYIFQLYRPISSYSRHSSEFGVVFTTRGPNHINNEANLHKYCRSSLTNRIACLYPNCAYLMTKCTVCPVSWNRMLSFSLLHIMGGSLQLEIIGNIVEDLCYNLTLLCHHYTVYQHLTYRLSPLI